MAIIGVIAEKDEEVFIKKYIERNLVEKATVLFLHEKTVQNIKNILFETIIITRNFANEAILKEILKKVKYLVINSDLPNILKLLEGIDALIITYGFNPKATITASSVTKENMVICLQRDVENKRGQIIETQEIKIETKKDVYMIMACYAIKIMYHKDAT